MPEPSAVAIKHGYLLLSRSDQPLKISQQKKVRRARFINNVWTVAYSDPRRLKGLDDVTAKQSYQMASKMSVESGQTWLKLLTISKVAEMFKMQGLVDRAVELFALSVVHPTAMRRDKGPALDWLAQLQTRIPQATFDAAVERGKVLDLDTVLQELMRE